MKMDLGTDFSTSSLKNQSKTLVLILIQSLWIRLSSNH